MTIGQFEVIEHTETVKPERFVIFIRKNNNLERALYLGKRGGFKTREEAIDAATKQAKYGTANV